MIHLGIVGAGQIASEVHIPALRTLADARIDWITDRDAVRARLVARSFGIPRFLPADDPGNLPPADVVLLAIPYGARSPYYRVFGKRGAAMYVEKPFALGLGEHDALCALFPPERLACGYQKRSWGPAMAMRELIRTRTFGRLLSARVEYGGPGITTSGRYSTSLQAAGGGVLFEVGVHAIDLLLYTAGAVSARVRSVEMVRHEGFDIHTEAKAVVTDASGGEIDVELIVTSLRFTAMHNTLSFEHADVTFEVWSGGAIRVKPRGSEHAFEIRSPALALPATSTQVFHAHWTRFLHGCKTGVINPACAVETRVTTELIEQLYAGGP
jgi:predicted dehydrogenase